MKKKHELRILVDSCYTEVYYMDFSKCGGDSAELLQLAIERASHGDFLDEDAPLLFDGIYTNSVDSFDVRIDGKSVRIGFDQLDKVEDGSGIGWTKVAVMNGMFATGRYNVHREYVMEIQGKFDPAKLRIRVSKNISLVHCDSEDVFKKEAETLASFEYDGESVECEEMEGFDNGFHYTAVSKGRLAYLEEELAEDNDSNESAHYLTLEEFFAGGDGEECDEEEEEYEEEDEEEYEEEVKVFKPLVWREIQLREGAK